MRLAPLYADRAVCVTGGAGFIGSHLVDALLSLGATISVIDDLSNAEDDHIIELMELEPQRVRFVHASILDDEAMMDALRVTGRAPGVASRGVDVCFHLAAMGSVPASLADPRRSWAINATGTTRVLDAARRIGVRRVINASSSSVYGESGGPDSLRPIARVETQLPAPLSPYAASKLAGEAAARAWSTSFGLSTASLRFFNVFGPRQPAQSTYAAVVPAFCRQILAGRAPVIFGDGSQSRDFTPVACAVSACLLAGISASSLTGQAMNIGTGTTTPVVELARTLADLCGCPDLAPAFQPARPGDIRHSLADIALARATIDYAPVMSTQAALQEAVLFYRQSLASSAGSAGTA
jgi:nucleoside-diphosphate-sugar epimerase